MPTHRLIRVECDPKWYKKLKDITDARGLDVNVFTQEVLDAIIKAHENKDLILIDGLVGFSQVKFFLPGTDPVR